MAIPGLTGGSSKPLLKYDAKARCFKVDDKVLNTLTAIIDVERAGAGWIKFADGTTPAFELVAIDTLAEGAPYPPQPQEFDGKGKPAWRRGFRCQVKLSDQTVADGAPTVREWASCAFATARSFDQLHDLWLAGRKPGQVPVCKCEQFEEEPGQFGSSYRPVWKILKWVKRPDNLVEVPNTPQGLAVSSGKPEDFSEDDWSE